MGDFFSSTCVVAVCSPDKEIWEVSAGEQTNGHEVSEGFVFSTGVESEIWVVLKVVILALLM